MLASENWVDISISIKHKKNGRVRSSCACTYAYVVALTSELGRGPITGHFDLDLMPTYQKQYGGRFVRHFVYHWVEES